MRRNSTPRPPFREGATSGVSPAYPTDDLRIVGSADQHLQPFLADARALSGLLNLGRSTVLKLDASGRLPRAIRLGRRKLWSVREVRDWIAAGCPARDRWEAMKGVRR